MNYVIYGLIDSGNDELFYIGISKQSGIRLSQHRQKPVGMSKKELRVQAIRAAGHTVSMVYIDCVQTSRQAKEREKFWIACYLAAGYRLTNGMHNNLKFDGDPLFMLANYPPVPMLSDAQYSALRCFSNQDVVYYISGDTRKVLIEKGLIEKDGWLLRITGYGRFTLGRYLNSEFLINCA